MRGRHLKSNRPVAFQHVPATNLVPRSVHLLIDHGPSQPYRTFARIQDGSAVIFDANLPGAVKRQRDELGIRTGTDDKIELELLLVPVIDQIHPRIHMLVLYLRVARHVRAPAPAVAPDDVVALSGRRIASHDAWRRICAYKFHPEPCRRCAIR